jgi:hypothetical protein
MRFKPCGLSRICSGSSVARDTQGNLVGNLTRNDIELYEDAVPQKIEFFARSTDLPLTLGVFGYLTISAVGEVLLCLWLVVVGVNAQRWKEQAGAAGVQA